MASMHITPDQDAVVSEIEIAAPPERVFRALIERDAPRQEVLPFVSDHPMIRPLSEYQKFVHDAFQKEVHK